MQPPPNDAYPVADPATAEAVSAGMVRALRSGHPTEVVARWRAAVEAAEPGLRRWVLDPLDRAVPRSSGDSPLVLGSRAARQVDPTTCGSAVLALLAAAGDPLVAWGLATANDPSARFDALQLAVKQTTNRHACGVLPWPHALGTPPWAAARHARFADVVYSSRPVDDARPAGRRVIVAALAAAARGVPVPLYTGGDLRTGWSTAIPRHVVLLTATDGDRCTIYEPSGGRLHHVPAAGLVDPGESVRAALGWPRVCWALLPAGRRGRRAGGSTLTGR